MPPKEILPVTTKRSERSASIVRSRSRSSRLGRQLGSAMLEFTLSAAILFTMTYGVIEIGHPYYVYSYISNAARDGARFAIVRGSTCMSWVTACPATATDVQNYVLSTVMPGIDPSRLTVTTTWIPNNNSGSAVRVTVNYRFSFIVPFVHLNDTIITSSSQMIIWQ